MVRRQSNNNRRLYAPPPPPPPPPPSLLLFHRASMFCYRAADIAGKAPPLPTCCFRYCSTARTEIQHGDTVHRGGPSGSF